MTVRVERAGFAVVVTIDRPETKNAIDRRTANDLGEAIEVASRDASVRGIVLTGGGDDTFVSGGDLKEFTKASVDANAVLEMFASIGIIEYAEVPIVVAVQGNVFGGGCELMLLCDLVLVEEHASIAFLHAKMGLSPAWGGLTRLVERVGPAETARLMFTAERISAAEALRIGLANEVVPKGTSRTRAIACVERIADNPRQTVAAMKRTLRDVREARRGNALAIERAAFKERWGGPDHRRALEAFASGARAAAAKRRD